MKKPAVPKHTRSRADLVPDPDNANRGTVRGRQLLEESLKRFGAGRAVLTDRHNRVIAGNKTVETAKRLGLRTRVIETDGRQLVVVRRTDLDLVSDQRAKALAIADNRIAELDLQWDADVLRRLKSNGLDLAQFWTLEEFQEQFGVVDAAVEDRGVVIPPDSSIRVGNLFRLGGHRLLCGDATHADHVSRLLGGVSPLVMVSDPPYGVCYKPEWRHQVNPSQRTTTGNVVNDDRADWRAAFALFPGDVIYAWHAGLFADTVLAALRSCEFEIRSQIIWVKQHFALSRGAYHWGHEPCWFAVRKGKSSHWCGDRRQTTVWESANLNSHGGAREGENAVTGHATQKPVRLFEVPMRNHTRSGDTVYDPFCGSGTAVIAAEKLGRRCFAMDVDPRYVQATISRWETYTGKTAELLGDTNEPGRSA